MGERQKPKLRIISPAPKKDEIPTVFDQYLDRFFLHWESLKPKPKEPSDTSKSIAESE